MSEGAGDETVEAPESHGHAHHGGTGIKWFDISLALAALITSIVSLWIGLMHGHDMSQLVQANSIPYLQIGKGDMDDDLKVEAARLSVANQGVGPARIADVRITVDGKPVPNLNTLIDRCCAPGFVAAGQTKGVKSFDGIVFGEIFKSTMLDRMLRPGESIDMINWRFTSANQKPARALLDAIGKRVQISICYCSVFDECWMREYRDHRPKKVDACPISPVPYSD